MVFLNTHNKENKEDNFRMSTRIVIDTNLNLDSKTTGLKLAKLTLRRTELFIEPVEIDKLLRLA